MPSNPLSAAAAAAAAAAVLLAHPASAFPWYIPFNPNALAVKGVAAIGHINPAGGGERNPYGLAFAANAHKWNLTLACEDSDGDGWPNGWELGDPCGNWTGGLAKPTWTDDISLPGLKSSVPQTRSLPLDWTGVCGANPCSAAASAAAPAAAAATTTRLRGAGQA